MACKLFVIIFLIAFIDSFCFLSFLFLYTGTYTVRYRTGN